MGSLSFHHVSIAIFSQESHTSTSTVMHSLYAMCMRSSTFLFFSWSLATVISEQVREGVPEIAESLYSVPFVCQYATSNYAFFSR